MENFEEYAKNYKKLIELLLYFEVAPCLIQNIAFDVGYRACRKFKKVLPT